MSELLPLFPLPNVVLFPNVFLPLHVFEPRYRDMVADALAGDRQIGMVLLRSGWESDYDGRPPIYSIACSGLMTHVERLPDGKYNLVLRGVERVRITGEDHGRPYRRGFVTRLPERPLSQDDRHELHEIRTRLEALVVPAGADARLSAEMPDEDLVNALAQYLDLEPIEKQALLEHDVVLDRARALVELLEMKMLIARTTNLPRGLTH